MKPTLDKPTNRQISIFEAAARAPFDPGIARGVQWGIWESAWIAANSEEATGQDGGSFYRLPERANRDYWQARCAPQLALDAEKLAHTKTLNELKAEHADLAAARARIDQLIDANLKAQDIKHQLDGIKITADETARAAQVILANTSKAKTGISAGKASKIWEILSPADAPTDDTIRNWIKQGHLPKHPNVQITENDLATKASFVQWLMTAFETMGRGRLTPTESQQKRLNDV